MRILLLADIHANWAALQAIQESHDLCLCLGDLVGYGLEPAPVIDWVRQRAHHAVRGNHDHWLVEEVRVPSRDGLGYLSERTRPLCRDKLASEDLRFLRRLPLSRYLTIEGTRYFLVHATPRDPLNELAPADSDFWARQLQNVDADVVVVGHSHQPYVLPVGSKLVINPGSVGQPRDGDPRASYIVIEERRVEIKRAAYPIEDTLGTIQDSSLPDHAKKMLTAIFQTGGKTSASGSDGQGRIDSAGRLALESG